MPDPSNPITPGGFQVTSAVYASPGLNYSGRAELRQFVVFDAPTASFSTRRISLAGIADFDHSVSWPFDNRSVPINGLLRIPKGAGPFPLALFAHGNHDPLANSTPGYLYLCDLLASHGIIAGTIDANFLNGSNRGENDGRAILHLEHVKQFRIWNLQDGHSLKGRVDLSRVLIAGHSRGGEAVGHASLFNAMDVIQFDRGAPAIPVDGSSSLGPYKFSIKAVVAISPTDKQYIPVSGPTRVQDNYLLMHGSRDGDVSIFLGHQTYDRTFAVDLAAPRQRAGGFKAMVWVHGANHNFFNSTWPQESSNTVSRADQEQIAKAYIGSIARAMLLDQTEYIELLRDQRLGNRLGWVPAAITVVSQYQSPDRFFLQHCEELSAGLEVSAPALGSAKSSSLTAEKQSFDLGPGRHLFQDRQGVKVDWTSGGGRYTLDLDPASLDADQFEFLALRVAQSFEPNNKADRDQDLTISVEDGAGAVTIVASTIRRLPYPDAFPATHPDPAERTEPITVLQTLLIPLGSLRDRGLDTNHIRRVELLMNATTSGTVYLSDFQLVNA